MKFTLFISLIILLFSMNTFADPVVVSGGTENDYESWIIRMNDGRLMVIFDRNPDWASGDIYVTFSEDDGETWSEEEPIIVAPGDQATLSFVQLPSDTLLLWFASNHTGIYKIYQAHSLDGLEWIQDGIVDLGWSESVNYYDPTVILEPDGSLTMSYIVLGGGAYISHKPAGGNWDTEQTLVGNSGYRARLMKHSDGTYLYAYHKNTGGNNYEVFVRTSLDRTNWSTPLQLTNSGNSHDPFPYEMSDGAYMIYYATAIGSNYNLWRSRSYDAINWEPEEQITTDTTNNTQPHFFVENGQIYLVWAHAVTYPNDHDIYFETTAYYTHIQGKGIAINPASYVSLNVFPNPFNPETTIKLDLSNRSKVNLTIYDVTGILVKTLIADEKDAGQYFVKWGGKNEVGESVNSGIYLYKLETEGQSQRGSLILLK